MQQITPNIWFDRSAAEAGAFYTGALPRTTARTVMRYPTDGLPEFQRSFAGDDLLVEVVVDGFRLLLINAGDEFRPNSSISFLLAFDVSADPDARAALDRAWAGLSDGGRVLMPLGPRDYSDRYGWIEDRYGVSWQLVLVDGDGEQQPFLTPCLTFAGAASGRARDAVDVYTDVLPGGALLGVSEDESTGTIAYASFALAGEEFAAMDAAPDQPAAPFTVGVSLQIDCADQDEIDRLWDALSSVPEAEQCGWCVDRFGVSWQVVPAAMEHLMDSPAAYRAMLGMKKLVIADLEAAAR